MFEKLKQIYADAGIEYFDDEYEVRCIITEIDDDDFEVEIVEETKKIYLTLYQELNPETDMPFWLEVHEIETETGYEVIVDEC